MHVLINLKGSRVFKYKDYESVRDVMFGFKIFPIDLYLIKAKLCFIGNASRSNRVLLNRSAIWCRFSEYANKFKMYGFDYNLLKTDIMGKLWLRFEKSMAF